MTINYDDYDLDKEIEDESVDVSSLIQNKVPPESLCWFFSPSGNVLSIVRLI